MPKFDYDVVIVGAGPAGLFAAHHLSEHSDLRVLVLERGKGPLKRRCRIGDYRECVKCTPCDILSGVGGAGLFSDGKLNFIHTLGKTDLTQFMPAPEAERLIEETEEIFNRFGMDGPVYPTDMDRARDIRKQAKRLGPPAVTAKKPPAATPEKAKPTVVAKPVAPAPSPPPVLLRPLTTKELVGTAIEVRNGTWTHNLAHQARTRALSRRFQCNHDRQPHRFRGRKDFDLLPAGSRKGGPVPGRVIFSQPP